MNKEENFDDVKKKLILEMNKNSIDYCIVIPDNVSGTNCADMSKAYKIISNDNRFFMMATLRIEEVKNRTKKIENLFKKGKVVGFKIFPGHDPIYPTDKRWYPIYSLCEKYNIPLVIHTGINSNNSDVAKYNDPKYAVEIAKKYKNLKIVIAHYFWPNLDYCYKVTDKINNIYFDTSAMADQEIIEKSGGINKIKKILLKTIKRNPKNVVFGTDWPITKISDHIDLINSLPISKIEKNNIFYKNSMELYHLDIFPPLIFAK